MDGLAIGVGILLLYSLEAQQQIKNISHTAAPLAFIHIMTFATEQGALYIL